MGGVDDSDINQGLIGSGDSSGGDDSQIVGSTSGQSKGDSGDSDSGDGGRR